MINSIRDFLDHHYKIISQQIITYIAEPENYDLPFTALNMADNNWHLVHQPDSLFQLFQDSHFLAEFDNMLDLIAYVNRREAKHHS